MARAQFVARAQERGASARACIEAHDAWGVFDASGGLISTGPTRTNVNDCRDPGGQTENPTE
jgi:hydroxypyruvate reductase